MQPFFAIMLMPFTTQEMNEKLLKIMLSDYLFLVKRQSTKVGYTKSQIESLEKFIETLENNPMPEPEPEPTSVSDGGRNWPYSILHDDSPLPKEGSDERRQKDAEWREADLEARRRAPKIHRDTATGRKLNNSGVASAIKQGFEGVDGDANLVAKNPYISTSDFGDAWVFGRYLAANEIHNASVDKKRNVWTANGKSYKVDGDEVLPLGKAAVIAATEQGERVE